MKMIVLPVVPAARPLDALLEMTVLMTYVILILKL